MKQPDFITEHVFELQHEVKGKFLDIKGTIADAIREAAIFPDWQIDANLIKFYNGKTIDDKDIEAIISYNLIRFMSYDPSTKNYFEEQLKKFIKTLRSLDVYDIPKINRFGVRTKCFIPSQLTFNDIFKRISQSLNNEYVSKLVGGIPNDTQLSFNTSEHGFTVRVTIGPIKPKEAKNYFSFKSDKLSSSGTYIDIDCFQVQQIENNEINELINKAMKITWQKIENITNVLGV